MGANPACIRSPLNTRAHGKFHFRSTPKKPAPLPLVDPITASLLLARRFENQVRHLGRMRQQ
jgi:hypothetical protein